MSLGQKAKEKMLCYVSYLNGHRKSLVLEVDVDPKADGQEYLNKVCHMLGILEVDYFGLKFRGSKRESLWLNLRNHVEDQLPGSPPYQLQLRVKFCVQPHYILTDVTRKLFYLQMLEELHAGRLDLGEWPTAAHFVALIAQAEHGDHSVLQRGRTPVEAVYRELMEGVLPAPSRSLLAAVEEEHKALGGMLPTSARYAMLQDVATHPQYGMEYHQGKLLTPAHLASLDDVKVAVGPQDIVVLQPNEHTVIARIEYVQIHVATHTERTVILEMLTNPYDTAPKEVYSFKLISKRAAIALYRAVTEVHSFFRCDTVCKDICTQFQRDFIGTFASIFNENTSLGKQYIFDIKRTWREAYDHCRRQLFMAEQRGGGLGVEAMETEEEEEGTRSLDTSHNSRCQALERELEAWRDAFLCCVCMDCQISSVLRPCSHVVCCLSCAERLATCPVCRATIDQVQHAFLPCHQPAASHGHPGSGESGLHLSSAPATLSHWNDGAMGASGQSDIAHTMAAEGFDLASLTEAALSPQVRSLYSGLVEHRV